MNDVPVLIVGGGPVGMILALELGRRNVSCLLLEETDRSPAVPRASSFSARSMEHFRKLGIAGRIRSSGLPADYPTDVSYRTRICGPELHRIALPSSARILAAAGSGHSGPTAEPQHRISQLYVEPILLERSRDFPHVRIERGSKLEGFEETDHGVRAFVRSATTGETRTVTADHLVGCDGGGSTVRKTLGIELTGDETVLQAITAFYRVPQLAELVSPPAWMTWSVNGEVLCVTVAVDGRDHWLIHAFYPAGTDTSGVDAGALLTQAIGRPTPHEVLGIERWAGRRLVADRYSSERVFLAGDSAHLWVPMAGMGMNIGIDEAMHLAWMLAAVHQGWAGPDLLAAYEAERRPVAEAVSGFATGIGKGLLDLVSAEVNEEDSTAGIASRQRLGREVAVADSGQFTPMGLSFGYHYHGSPLIAADRRPPEFSVAEYHPSITAGARLPHLVLEDGTPIYDRLGRDFTLLRIGDQAPDPEPVVRAASACGVPLQVLELLSPAAIERYRSPLLLVRPDQYVAWHGAAIPESPRDLIDRVRGAGVPTRNAGVGISVKVP
ncbi:FAD-dependent monooxygenase [Nocardia flavorosea]|uniref:FAD-monooxygenase n=1 Tax=Nocardia flavorosea TaxID=53429 RepID=A0A846YB26_9NOCA|nr:FAD-dependent monooxygenase [Nocardia flavorosea]NKY54981.1 FAD-monooxygenase [Nocardia flavorosea]